MRDGNQFVAMQALANLATVNKDMANSYNALMPSYKDYWSHNNDMEKQKSANDAAWQRTKFTVENENSRAVAAIEARYNLAMLEQSLRDRSLANQRDILAARSVDALKRAGANDAEIKATIMRIYAGGNVGNGTGSSDGTDSQFQKNTGYAKPGTIANVQVGTNPDGTPIMQAAYDKETDKMMKALLADIDQQEDRVKQIKSASPEALATVLQDAANGADELMKKWRTDSYYFTPEDQARTMKMMERIEDMRTAYASTRNYGK